MNGEVISKNTFKYLEHLIKLNGSCAIPDLELRPTVSVKSSIVQSFIVDANSSSGALLILSRRDGGIIFAGGLFNHLSFNSSLTGTAPLVVTTPTFLPWGPLTGTLPPLPGILQFSPDLSTNFKYTRPSAMRVIMKSASYGINNIALSGTFDAVSFNDFGDLTSTDKSTYPTIATTTKDVESNLQVKNGVVVIAGPEIVGPLKQPFTRSGVTAQKVTDWTRSVIISSPIVLGAGSAGDLPVAQITIGNATAYNGAPSVAGLALPNDLVNPSLRFDLYWNYVSSSEPIGEFSFFIGIMVAWRSPTTGYSAREIKRYLAGGVPTTSYITAGSSASSGSLLVSLEEMQNDLLLSSAASDAPFTVTGITLGIVRTALSVETTVTTLQMQVTVNNYYDNMNSPPALIQWSNVGTQQEMTINADRYSEAVPSGTLSQFITQANQTGGNAVMRSESPENLLLINALFNDPTVSSVKRVYKGKDYLLVKDALDVSQTAIANTLHAAGLFGSLGRLLSGVVRHIPVAGRILSKIAPHAGDAVDDILSSRGRHNKRLQYTPNHIPRISPGQKMPHTIVTGLCGKAGSTVWNSFPGVDNVGKVHILHVVISPFPIKTMLSRGELRDTPYLPIDIAADRGLDDRTIMVSLNLLEDQDAISQIMDLLMFTNIKDGIYVTVPYDFEINGASFGLALTANILGVTMQAPMTGVVHMENEGPTVTYIDELEEKYEGVRELNLRLIAPISNISDTDLLTIPAKVTTPANALMEHDGYTDAHIILIAMATELCAIKIPQAQHIDRTVPQDELVPMFKESIYMMNNDHRVMSSGVFSSGVFSSGVYSSGVFAADNEFEILDEVLYSSGLQELQEPVRTQIAAASVVHLINQSDPVIKATWRHASLLIDKYVTRPITDSVMENPAALLQEGEIVKNINLIAEQIASVDHTRRLEHLPESLDVIRPSQDVRDYELFPVIEVKSGHLLSNLMAIKKMDNNDPVVGVRDNPNNFTGAEIFLYMETAHGAKLLKTKRVVKGRSWEYAYLVLYGKLPYVYKGAYTGSASPDGNTFKIHEPLFLKKKIEAAEDMNFRLSWRPHHEQCECGLVSHLREHCPNCVRIMKDEGSVYAMDRDSSPNGEPAPGPSKRKGRKPKEPYARPATPPRPVSPPLPQAPSTTATPPTTMQNVKPKVDNKVLQERFHADFSELAKVSTNYQKFLAIFDFLDSTGTTDDMYRVVAASTAVSPQTGEQSFLVKPISVGLATAMSIINSDKGFKTGVKTIEMGYQPGTNLANQIAIGKKTEKIATAESQALRKFITGVPIDWVVENGNRGLDDTQRQYVTVLKKLPSPSMTKAQMLNEIDADTSTSVEKLIATAKENPYVGSPAFESVIKIWEKVVGKPFIGGDENHTKSILLYLQKGKYPKGPSEELANDMRKAIGIKIKPKAPKNPMIKDIIVPKKKGAFMI